MRFFANCTTINEVKSLYRELAKANHPDKGGDLETMQSINAEYTFACAKVLKGENLSVEDLEAEILNAEGYKQAVNLASNLVGVNVELCGGWIWCSGNTYPHKDALKSVGFYFASAKKMWYFRSAEKAVKGGKPQSMEKIRGKYGSQSVAPRSYSIAN